MGSSMKPMSQRISWAAWEWSEVTRIRVFGFVSAFTPDTVNYQPDMTAYVGFVMMVVLVFGLAFSALSMAGDLLSSFIKRRRGLPSGARSTALDQLPEAHRFVEQGHKRGNVVITSEVAGQDQPSAGEEQ